MELSAALVFLAAAGTVIRYAWDTRNVAFVFLRRGGGRLQRGAGQGGKRTFFVLPGLFTGRVTFRGPGRARVTRPDP